MLKIKSLLIIASAFAVCIAFTGCSVINYNASLDKKFEIPVGVKQQYKIVSAETVTLKPLGDEDPLSSKELAILNASLDNAVGQEFEKYWKKAVPELFKASGCLDNVVSKDLTSWQLSVRSVAPTVFSTTKGIPVNVRAVSFIRPAVINPWWMMSYLLSASILSPLQKRSLGGVIVAVLDDKGRTIDSRVVIFRRSYWFSTLFPWALLGGGQFADNAAGTASDKIDEKSLLIKVMAQAVAEMLSGKSKPVPANSEWRNIRSAAIEAIAAGNNADALKLIQVAHKRNLGGDECKAYLEILD
jgi:hypothetical protein